MFRSMNLCPVHSLIKAEFNRSFCIFRVYLTTEFEVTLMLIESPCFSAWHSAVTLHSKSNFIIIDRGILNCNSIDWFRFCREERLFLFINVIHAEIPIILRFFSVVVYIHSVFYYQQHQFCNSGTRFGNSGLVFIRIWAVFLGNICLFLVFFWYPFRYADRKNCRVGRDHWQ